MASRPRFFIRVNGIAHAGRRNDGCSCSRCTAVNTNMPEPPGELTAFPGWQDPPERAHTSISLLVRSSDDPRRVGTHVLIDVGDHVVDSLDRSAIPGIWDVDALLLTHWHSDHIMGHADLSTRARHTARRIPPHCHPDSYAQVYSGQGDTIAEHFDFVPNGDGVPFRIGTFTFTPYRTDHNGRPGCMSYVCVEERTGVKMVFAWDIDLPGRKPPEMDRSNLDAFQREDFRAADLLIIESNTWQVSEYVLAGEDRRTGHTNFLAGWQYVQACKPRTLGITHLSGHEDEVAPDQHGYGWPDRRWIQEARAHAANHPIDGRRVHVHEFYQGTVVCSDALARDG